MGEDHASDGTRIELQRLMVEPFKRPGALKPAAIDQNRNAVRSKLVA